MANLNERGAKEGRGSALWGTGKGGDRSSVLWGKGGRGILLACVAALALTAPMVATADSGKSGPIASSFIAPSLLNATGQVDVIIQSSGGTSDAIAKATGLGVFQKNIKRLDLIGAVEATVPAAQLKKLQGIPGLIVTPNSTVKVSGGTSLVQSSQLWPYESGNANLVERGSDDVRRQGAGNRDRRLRHPGSQRLRQPRDRERQPPRRSRATRQAIPTRWTTSAGTAPSSRASRRARRRTSRAPLRGHRLSRSRS